MAQPLFTNNASTTLASSITNVATSLTVLSATGGLFPSPTGSNYFYLTLQNTAGTVIEIVKCTARSGDTLTIVRGQEGTTASAFSSGDVVELRLTAKGIADNIAYSRGYRVRVLSSGTTYTTPADVSSIWVFVYGAGSGTNLAVSGSGGSGGTGYSEKYYATPASSYTYSIPALPSNCGISGGTTTFDVMTVTGASAGTNGPGGAGGAGGAGSGGDFNATGGTGGTGFTTTQFGGVGGPGSRAGNGGNGGTAASGVAGAGGGTGGNNASGNTPGAAATTVSGSAISVPWATTSDEFFFAGTSVGPAPVGPFWTTLPLPLMKTSSVFSGGNFPSMAMGSFNSNGPYPSGGTNSATTGFITIVEALK